MHSQHGSASQPVFTAKSAYERVCSLIEAPARTIIATPPYVPRACTSYTSGGDDAPH